MLSFSSRSYLHLWAFFLDNALRCPFRCSGVLSSSLPLWLDGAYLHALNTTTNRSDGPLMVTWRATDLDRDRTFYFDDGRGNGRCLLVGVHPSALFFRSSGLSKRKRSSDRDPKHARGTRKDTSSSRGSRVVPLVVEVSSSASEQEHTELIDNGECPECLTMEVVESCPPALPTLTIAQEAEIILRAGVSYLRSCICTRIWIRYLR
ncbi:hypothetical protein LIER_14171 [Lithospermum erythrorhizon]|uniref:Uncharacterized protein n=1 Tax=Lithospermum erythrorhizon TaxID=34254 RepID=A0AAV3PY64_LITER